MVGAGHVSVAGAEGLGVGGVMELEGGRGRSRRVSNVGTKSLDFML